MIFTGRVARRLQEAVLAAQRRGRAAEQLGDPPPPRPPQPLVDQLPADVADKIPEKDKVQFGEQPSETTPPAANNKETKEDKKHSIGKKVCRPGRFSKIRGWKPFLVVISGANEVEKLGPFFQEGTVSGILNNEAFTEMLLGKQPDAGNRGIDTVYAYLTTEQNAKALKTAAAELFLPVYIQDMEAAIGKSQPFIDIKFSQAIDRSLGGNTILLTNALQGALNKIKQCEGETSGGEISAIQVHGSVPLHYLRFLSTKHQQREYYVGGQPTDAGRVGMIYALCSEEEADLFRKEMKDFGHPPLFYQDLLPLADIDPGFKSPAVRPRTVVPANCLILKSSRKFELEKPVKEGSDVTILDALGYFAMKIAPGAKGGMGSFIEGSLVRGTLNLHFNKAQNQCIMWGTQQPMNITDSIEAKMKDFFDLIEINKRYSR